MTEKLTFLGIETSCDETAESIVRENGDGTGKSLTCVENRIPKNLWLSFLFTYYMINAVER